jgi:TonB family protein
MTLLPQLSAEKTMNNNKMGPFSEQKTQKNLVTKSNSHIKNNRLHTNNPNIPIQKHQNKEKNTNHSSIQDKYLIDAETTQHNITEDAMEPITTPVDVQAAYARNPSPPYPTLARRMGTQGRLVLRVQVSEQGHVTQIQLKTSSHSELLDNAARQAVLHWQFNPAQKAGKAISTWVDVPITFQLNT